MKDELIWLGIAEAGRLVREGQVSFSEIVEETLGWIHETNDILQAYAVILEDEALKAASVALDEIRNGTDRGALHGMTYSVKELIAVQGVPMARHSAVLGAVAPDQDASVVTRMRAAGGVCLGTVRAHEFGWGVYTRGTLNPWDGRSVPGGSSGGSGAAVAAGQCAFSIGTDCATSIRTPAALNGVVGLRATQGRVSTRGVIPVSMTMDTAGPLARSVEDMALILGHLAGHDALDTTSSPMPVPDYATGIGKDVKGLRVGVPTDHFFSRMEPAVEHGVETALATLQDLGATLIEVPMPHAHYATGVLTTIICPEGAAYHDHYLSERAAEYGTDVKTFLELGNFILAKDYCRAYQMRTLIAKDFEEAFGFVDIVVTPAVPATAKVFQDDPWWIHVRYPDGYSEELNETYLRYTAPVTLAGYPALVVPCGFGNDSLPIGLQIIAPPFCEAALFNVGHLYQQATEWHKQRPVWISTMRTGNGSGISNHTTARSDRAADA